ncbi:MAG: YchJ family metal-binding protein [Nibricoccus sp.]
MSLCPCGSNLEFDACCGPIIAGAAAPTAEALMRSRYSAYVKHEYAHLEKSLSAAQRKDFDAADSKRWAESSEWLGLTIHQVEKGGVNDDTGMVHFTAKFRTEGKDHDHVEAALFTREDGRWVYSGFIQPKGNTVRREEPKIGRNDPCPCGSGKKYKKCCGAKS